MSELLQEIIKSLIRSELKTELSNLSLSLSLTFKLRRLIFNKKKWGFNTLIEPLNEENNMLDKPEKRINHYRLIWQKKLSEGCSRCKKKLSEKSFLLAIQIQSLGKICWQKKSKITKKGYTKLTKTWKKAKITSKCYTILIKRQKISS